MTAQIPENDRMPRGDDWLDLASPVLTRRAVGEGKDDGRPRRTFGRMMLVVDRNSVVRRQKRHSKTSFESQ